MSDVEDEVGDVQQHCNGPGCAYNQDGVVYQHWDCNRPEEGGACYGEDGYRVECGSHVTITIKEGIILNAIGRQCIN